VTETLERPARRETRTQPEPRVGRHRRPRIRALPALGVGAAVAGLTLLAVRIVEDVGGKPLFEDEAVAGLVSARPFGEVLQTVWWERGGAPLHFVLSHLALAPDGSPFALRWLSVVFALAAVPLAWDLGRRLGGHVAAGASALVVAASPMLWVYGSFGRMYSLYVFASALAVDLFVRAVQERTTRAAVAAALAAWLVPAVHPYGIFLVAVEAAVALWLWRGRPLRAALPVGIVALGLVPFLVADVRLADRFSVGLEGDGSVAPAGDAWLQLGRAFQATAGGTGWTLGVAAALAALGFVVLLRTRAYPFVALLLGSAVLPALLLVLAKASSAPGLSPRHLAYLVPLVAVLVGVGVAQLVRGLDLPVAAIALAAVGIVVALAPIGGIRDPRDWPNDVLGGGASEAPLGSSDELAEPKAWLEANVDPGAVLFPYSAVYLAALPTTREGDTLPYAQRETLLRALDRVDSPVPEVFVSIPIGESRVDFARLDDLLGPGFERVRFERWLLLRGGARYEDDREVLWAIYAGLAAARESTIGFRQDELGWYYTTTTWVVCSSLRSLGETCPPAGAGRNQ
jgi:Dolichyl-phosphate-mannose-protein mannosyltransferase